MKVVEFLKSFFVLLLIVGFGEIASAVVSDPATESVEIRANVPSSVGITILEGQNGLDLFDERGITKSYTADRTIKFKVDGNFLKAKLSFSGTDGLDWQSGGSSEGWSISHANNENKLGIHMDLLGIGQESNSRAIGNGEEIQVDHTDRDKEITVVVSPKVDVNTNPLAPGQYRGKLNITLKSAD